MKQDDIIRMAREAGAMFDHIAWVERDLAPIFERFAAMVEAAERNKLAAWMIERGYATGHGDTTEGMLQELEWQIAENWTNALVNGVAAEREACAKVAGWLWQQFQDTKNAHERNTMEPFKWGQFGFDQSTVEQSKRMMDAIRARGQT